MNTKQLLEKMNNTINEYVSKFGCKSVVGYDFSYYDDGLIEWTPFVLEESDKYFQKFVKEHYPHIEADSFIWSLFHEIGHHKTRQMWSEEDMDKFQKISELLESKLETDTNLDNIYNDYFNMENELIATDWAAKYLEEHSKEVSEFWNNFVKKYSQYYCNII